MNLTRIIAALDLYTDRLLGLLSDRPNAPTYAECADLYQLILAERGDDDAKAMLWRHGCRKMTDLEAVPGLWDEFYRYGMMVIQRGVSPTYAWSTLNGAPHHLRDRWLLWHDESDCLWEVRGKLSVDDLRSIRDQQVMDVSGVPRYEEEFKRRQTAVEDEL